MGSTRGERAAQLGRPGGFGYEPGAHRAIPAAAMVGPGMTAQ
jgi:hypothetical protein